MILLYAPTLSPRLEYTAGLIFKELMGMDFTITTEKEEVRDADSPAINYSQEPVSGCINMWSSGLLFEKELHPQQINTGTWGKHAAFFMSPEGYDLPFDLLAASFYLVSRYEEYQAEDSDKYGRFNASQSILYRLESLDKPLVNLWARKLRKKILQIWPNAPYTKSRFEYTSTLDIDMAFKYLHKGFIRNTGGMLRDALNLKTSRVFKRRQVLSGKEADPFNNFQYQFDLHERYGIKAVHFFQVGQRGDHDKNIPVSNDAFREIIKLTERQNDIGLHPSFTSNSDREILAEELSALEGVIDKPVNKSRQHFLVLQLPATYRNLIDAGIDEDYTMGYSTHSGFRAGIASPFYFYDLEREEITPLTVYPFAVMDVTLQHFYEMKPEAAIKHILKLMKIVKKVKGHFISAWHNESLSDQEQWKGWREVYEEMLMQASEYLHPKSR